MLQIYNQTTCPKWIRKKCEKGHEWGGIRYTCYFSDPKNSNTAKGREVLFYIAYSEIDLETMLSVVKALEFEKKHLHWSERFGKHETEQIRTPWKNKFDPIKWLQWLFFIGLFAIVVLKISFEIIKKIFIFATV